MSITAKVILDSTTHRTRLTTLELKYPKYIHAEFMTHRVFSRNGSSSRAIPIEKLIAQAIEDPVEPIFMYNQKGMAASEPLAGDDLINAKLDWDLARNNAIESARDLSALGVHKQLANRLLEPFTNITILVSATEWENFFKLRIHPDAQQEIQMLATCINEAMYNSKPTRLDVGQWHLPYILESEEGFNLPLLKKLSVARCARVSYLNHGASNTRHEDSLLHDRLFEAGHYSPFEHQATPWVGAEGNFRNWSQYRHLMGKTNRISE